MVISGQRQKLKEILGLEEPRQLTVREASQGRHAHKGIERQIEKDIKKIAGELLKITPQQLEVSENLGYFGFDSISLKALADKLSDTYQIEISPSVFFAHSSLQSLSTYLLEEFSEQMKAAILSSAPTAKTSRSPLKKAPAADPQQLLF